MKSIKLVGIFFVVIGLFFIIAGCIKYVSSYINKDERTSTVAYIVKIDEIKTNDPENPKDYIVYVEFEINNKMIISKLNTYTSKYRIGDKVDILL